MKEETMQLLFKPMGNVRDVEEMFDELLGQQDRQNVLITRDLRLTNQYMQENTDGTATYRFDVPGCRIEDIKVVNHRNVVGIMANRSDRENSVVRHNITVPDRFD